MRVAGSLKRIAPRSVAAHERFRRRYARDVERQAGRASAWTRKRRMKTTFRSVLFLVAFVFFGWNAASAQTLKLMWDEDTGSPVNGYSVTVDGVRVDYQLVPAGTNGA